MTAVEIEITEFVDEHQPGFVECVLIDAAKKKHTFIEKVPIVTTEDLWSTSAYPRKGVIACEVQERWTSEEGESLVRVSTEKPWSVESSEGLGTFVILASQLRTGAE